MMNFRETLKKIDTKFIFSIVAFLLISGVSVRFFAPQTATFESIAGKILNCKVGDSIEKTFTLNSDGTFKMMILPFDVWGNYEIQNHDIEAGTADIILTATNIFSEKGNRTSSLKNKELKWSMKIDFSKANSVNVDSDTVAMSFSDDEAEALWQVLSNERVILEGCFEE